jgi:hypothetical protein
VGRYQALSRRLDCESHLHATARRIADCIKVEVENMGQCWRLQLTYNIIQCLPGSIILILVEPLSQAPGEVGWLRNPQPHTSAPDEQPS